MTMIKLPSPTLAEEFRITGDPIFSDLVASLDHQILKEIWSLKDDAELMCLKDHPKLGPIVEAAVQLPVWANENSLKQSSRFFEDNTFQLMLMLGLVSLPYCYGGADGAKVLFASDRILEKTEQRLMETGGFVLDVCDRESFSGHGRGFLACLKVRLIHEFIRQKILTRGSWNTNSFGTPINQLDQAGTNLSFSLIAIRALRKMGMHIESNEADHYLHRWNVVASLLGLDDRLIPHGMKWASQLSLFIERYQFRASEEGEKLTASLITFIKGQEGFERFGKFIPSTMSFLLGEKISGYLGLKGRGYGIFELNSLINQLGGLVSWMPIARGSVESNRGKQQQIEMSNLPFLTQL